MSTIGQQFIFNYTGGSQTWIIPNDVGGIQIECYGAEGGGAGNGGLHGGTGGYAVGNLSTNTNINKTLNIYIGGKGGTVKGWSTPGSGGYNGGASGGVAGGSYIGGGGGGGSTDIRLGGIALTNRIIVAGGAGGSGGADANGGVGGGLTGGTGTTQGYCLGGLGGTQSNGGLSSGSGSSNGILGAGGSGGSGYYGGGGAGSGYYGGSGGMGGNGAGGGAGGSSYIGGITNGSTTAGGNIGNGKVIITILKLNGPTFANDATFLNISNQDILIANIVSNPNLNCLQAQYKILVNNNQIYPIIGYTTLINTPFDINYTIPNNLFNVGTNTIMTQMINESNLDSVNIITITKPLLSTYLIKDNNNIIYTFNGTNIIQSPSQILDDNNFINNGFANPLLINSMFQNYFASKKSLQFLYWTNDSTKNYNVLYNSILYRPIDKITDNFQVLMYEN